MQQFSRKIATPSTFFYLFRRATATLSRMMLKRARNPGPLHHTMNVFFWGPRRWWKLAKSFLSIMPTDITADMVWNSLLFKTRSYDSVSETARTERSFSSKNFVFLGKQGNAEWDSVTLDYHLLPIRQSPEETVWWIFFWVCLWERASVLLVYSKVENHKESSQ